MSGSRGALLAFVLTGLGACGAVWWQRAVRRDVYPAPRPADPLVVPEEMTVLGSAAEGHLALFAPPPAPDAATLTFLHGNAQNLDGALPLLREMRDAGFGVAYVEYPGYGALASTSCSERRLMASAEASVRAIIQRPEVGEMVLAGHSLGTAVAIEMAARGLGSGLVLSAPFTSTTAIFRVHAPSWVPQWVPLRPLLGTEALDSLRRAADVRQPVEVVHGDRDELFPLDMGRELATALHDAAFTMVPDADHATIARSIVPAARRLLARMRTGQPD